MEEIKLILDEALLDEYAKYYFKQHPKARKKPIEKPWHPSINEWMVMPRPQMNALKQKWKDFVVWWIGKLGYSNFMLNNFEMVITVFKGTRRRVDPDNQAPKMILDGMTAAGFIIDDDGSHLHSLTLKTDYDKEWPRTEIILRPCDGEKTMLKWAPEQEIVGINYEWFVINWDILYEKYGHKFLVIKDKKVIGVYNSFREAMDNTHEEKNTFTIEECTQKRNVHMECIATPWVKLI